MISKNIFKSLLVVGAMTALSVGTASAAGTAADTNVQNTFSLSYSVDGTPQPTIDTGPGGTNNPTEFTVDRKVDLTVLSNGNETVAPGEQDAELTFTLTNTGNDTQGYDLSLVNEAGDDFDASGLTITYYVGNSATGTELTYTPGTSTVDVPADGQLFVVVSGDIPTTGTVSDNDDADITLIADTTEPGAAGSTSVPVVADTDGTNDVTGAAENVLADGTSTSNEVANAGDDSATGTYIVASADLAAAKTVGIISEDGAGCTVAPSFPTLPAFPTTEHAIPGACIEYRITVENTGDDASADASDLELVDILPDGLTFVNAYQNGFTGGTFNKPAANVNCDSGACTVELTSTGAGTPAGLAFSSTGVIVIRATVTAN